MPAARREQYRLPAGVPGPGGSGIPASSQQEIAGREWDDAEDLYLKVGNTIAIDVAADEREVSGIADLVEYLVAQLALPAAKALRANEPETLVTPAGGVGIDTAEIDVIQSLLEVCDDIAGVGPDHAVCQRVEVEDRKSVV